MLPPSAGPIRSRRAEVVAAEDLGIVPRASLPLVVIDLPDADDRHVLAAAIKAHAQVIVTENVKHFPPICVKPWNVEARIADDFVLDLIDLSRPAVYAQVQRMADAWRDPPGTVEDVLSSLEHVGLVESVAALRD